MTDTFRTAEGGAAAADGSLAVPILVPDESGGLVLDERALRSVLMQDGVRHLPVVVVAVAGAFRRGKSFLLSLLLRFLERGGAADWLGAPDQPLAGFSWRGGRQRHTVGIHMWSRPARVRLPSGEEVAVVLMDTQGAFDDRTAVSENAAVFALSALTSSVQIYNVANTVGTDDLQHLQLFAEFGRVAAQSGHGTAFQKLLFLVRDWQYPTEAPYGSEGGQRVLHELLDSPPGAPEELCRMRQHVRQSFSDVDCFLMPHPGKKVATSPTFDGCPRDIDSEFLEMVNRLARLILSPERLVKKESDGQVLTAADLFTHFQAFHAVFQSGAMPEPKSLVNTMSEANHLAGVSRGSTLYAEQMHQVCSEEAPGVPQDELEGHHQIALQTAVADFDNKKKMLGEQGATYKRQLLDAIDAWKRQFFQANKMKNELEEARDGLCCNEALSSARDEYRHAMGELLGGGEGAVDPERLRERHRESCAEALRLFGERTVGCRRRQLVAEYSQRLQDELKDSWEEAELFNEQRSAGQDGAERDRTAMDQARTRYRNIMEQCMSGGPLDEDEFQGRQRSAEQEARNVFRSNRGEGHSAAPQVDQFFERQLHQEEQSMRSTNMLQSIIRSLMPLIVNVATKAASKCVVM